MRSPGPAALLVLLLAGCLGGKEPERTEPVTVTPAPSVALDVLMERPGWERGQVWTYRVEVPGVPTANFRMMVAEDAGDLWIVATNDRAQALNQALYSTNPVLGRITQSGLSPYQAGAPVVMFDFPLTDGKTWSGSFFGETMRFSATYSDTLEALPGTFLPGFVVRAQGAGEARVEYNYVEAVEWFTDFQVFDAEGRKQIHLILVDYGGAYAGPYHFLRGKDLLGLSLTQSTNLTAPPGFDVDEGGQFGRLGLGLRAEGTGDQPAVLNVTLKAPGGAVAYSRQHTLPRAWQEVDAVELAPAKGRWTLEVVIVGSAQVEVRTAGLVDFQGQL